MAAAPDPGDIRTARTTGALYLALAITGVMGFLVVRPQLQADDPATTLAQLSSSPALAGAGVALELGIVLTQALVALWFVRLFRRVDAIAAGAIGAFGLVNAVMVLSSAALLATARQVALDPALAPGGDAAATVQLAYVLSDNVWSVAALFFGLWLIPMGVVVLRSGWMPRALGGFLVAGGIGYALSAITGVLWPDASTMGTVLTIPANIGEFWMVGYLLVIGVRPRRDAATTEVVTQQPPPATQPS